MYQLWSHQMYPKTNLRDTLQTVEKLCHKRSVQVRVSCSVLAVSLRLFSHYLLGHRQRALKQ